MRLSDIKGERTLDVIADIIDPIANIAEDEVASDLFKREKLPEGMTAKKFLLQRARKGRSCPPEGATRATLSQSCPPSKGPLQRHTQAR